MLQIQRMLQEGRSQTESLQVQASSRQRRELLRHQKAAVGGADVSDAGGTKQETRATRARNGATRATRRNVAKRGCPIT